MNFDDNEKALILAAVAKGGKIWDDDTLSLIKRKIKTYCLEKTTHQCCYCRKDFTDEFNMVIDIEHVLPKSRYGDFIFQMFNLSVSCKRCNMKIKGERLDFLIDPNVVYHQPEDSSQYLLSHPNLDDYFQNLGYNAQFIDNKKFVKFVPKTNKGQFTYDFFKLNQMEIDTINEMQGIKAQDVELSEKIPSELIEGVVDLVDQLSR